MIIFSVIYLLFGALIFWRLQMGFDQKLTQIENQLKNLNIISLQNLDLTFQLFDKGAFKFDIEAVADFENQVLVLKDIKFLDSNNQQNFDFTKITRPSIELSLKTLPAQALKNEIFVFHLKEEKTKTALMIAIKKDTGWKILATTESYLASVFDFVKSSASTPIIFNTAGQVVSHVKNEYIGTSATQNPKLNEIISQSKTSGSFIYSESDTKLVSVFDKIPRSNLYFYQVYNTKMDYMIWRKELIIAGVIFLAIFSLGLSILMLIPISDSSDRRQTANSSPNSLKVNPIPASVSKPLPSSIQATAAAAKPQANNSAMNSVPKLVTNPSLKAVPSLPTAKWNLENSGDLQKTVMLNVQNSPIAEKSTMTSESKPLEQKGPEQKILDSNVESVSIKMTPTLVGLEALSQSNLGAIAPLNQDSNSQIKLDDENVEQVLSEDVESQSDSSQKFEMNTELRKILVDDSLDQKSAKEKTFPNLKIDVPQLQPAETKKEYESVEVAIRKPALKISIEQLKTDFKKDSSGEN